MNSFRYLLIKNNVFLGVEQQLSLANKAQFLLINKASVQWLLDDIPKEYLEDDIQNLIYRFRPNFVVNFPNPLVENNLSDIWINKIHFTVSIMNNNTNTPSPYRYNA